MKNPFQTKRVHVVSEDLSSMQTVTTVTLLGMPIYKTIKKQAITTTLF